MHIYYVQLLKKCESLNRAHLGADTGTIAHARWVHGVGAHGRADDREGWSQAIHRRAQRTDGRVKRTRRPHGCWAEQRRVHSTVGRRRSQRRGGHLAWWICWEGERKEKKNDTFYLRDTNEWSYFIIIRSFSYVMIRYWAQKAISSKRCSRSASGESSTSGKVWKLLLNGSVLSRKMDNSPPTQKKRPKKHN